MDLMKQGMKGPTRPAPAIPGLAVNRYSPVTNWDNDPFGADVFEPLPHVQKKKPPPPRPPPPKITSTQPDIPFKPSHFIRRPTVLSSLLSRKTKQSTSQSVNQQHIIIPEFTSDIDTKFAKCEPKNVQTGALIDLSSPPSSPTFTTRSSSDGLSVDSFGSDATTSTNHPNAHNGNASQAESGFEDDFDLFMNTQKSREETLDDFNGVDPFSPGAPSIIKPPIQKKPSLLKDPFDISNISQPQVPLLKGPTIIRAKPARPKPPDSAAILKNTFGNSFPVTTMSVNTTIPIQKVNVFGDAFESKPFHWGEESCPAERESSPPMPTIPPPPPPVVEEEHSLTWPLDNVDANVTSINDDEEPYAIALFDYFTDHPEDLCFTTNAKIKLIRRVDHEWLFGSLKTGIQGLFPSNYVEIKVPLPNDSLPSQPLMGTAVALYDLEPQQPGDLRFHTGDTILVRYKLNDQWYFGECNGVKGQFPINYVKME